MMRTEVSLVVPVYNEQENVPLLWSALQPVLENLGRSWEVVFVDDGSTDGSERELAQLAAADSRIKVVRFRRNYGQTAAMQAGIDHAAGEFLVFLDGDLQNDPAEIPKLLAALDAGYDLAHGWRKERHDAWLSRKLPSRAANWLISRVTGFPIHDLGCTLKAVRCEIARELELYGEMHRFIPLLAHARGARCIEVVTRHQPRRHGRTKYGLGRIPRVLLDLVTVKYMLSYFASPMKLFGLLGLCCLLIGLSAGSGVLGMKVFGGVDMTGNPLLLLTALGAMMGIQFLGLGLMGEVNARIYFGETRRNYAVRRRLNFAEETEPVLRVSEGSDTERAPLRLAASPRAIRRAA